MESDSVPASPDSEPERIKAAIARFLGEERLKPKLDKLKDGDEEGRAKLAAAHQPSNWIADAARRVTQIQQVSHAVKFTHPSAGGSNLSSAGNTSASPLELGTHSLPNDAEQDVVGNAAALDVLKFLRLTVNGRSLLERAVDNDPALVAALADDPEQAAAWMEAFAALPEPKGDLASHKLAKQIYWPLDDGGYHLLAPLFSSTLAHAVHRAIRHDRFSDEARAAREARREQRPHPHGFSDYPNIALQKFGGSKPQNISQLNNERHGENYLLASLPPNWQSRAVRPPLQVDSVFAARGPFGRRGEVRRLTEALRDFLRRVAGRESNLRIRDARHQLVAALADQVVQFAAELRELAPGWSAQQECALNLAEQCWLDPERSHSDEDFAALRRRTEWRQAVCRRFALWLNGALKTDKTHFGAPEATEWQAMLDQELRALREEMDDE